MLILRYLDSSPIQYFLRFLYQACMRCHSYQDSSGFITVWTRRDRGRWRARNKNEAKLGPEKSLARGHRCLVIMKIDLGRLLFEIHKYPNTQIQLYKYRHTCRKNVTRGLSFEAWSWQGDMHNKNRKTAKIQNSLSVIKNRKNIKIIWVRRKMLNKATGPPVSRHYEDWSGQAGTFYTSYSWWWL